MQTGLVSAVPFAIGARGMVWYGDRQYRRLRRELCNGLAGDLTGNFDSGLVVIAAVRNVSAFATLCIHHETELEQTPITDDTPPMPGEVAEIV
jgi:hypothetical protein